MPAQFDSDLAKLKERLLYMGSIAERMIRAASSALVENKMEYLDSIAGDEKELDLLQVDIDEETVRMIGVYTPVARDLRLLLMVARINAEIERIGDRAVSISDTYEEFFKEKKITSMVDFSPAAELAENMVRNSLNAFVDGSVEQAMSVIDLDDKVDKLTHQTTRALFTHMLDDARAIGYIFGLITVAQALEKIADHAVNICEDVVYIVKGKDIRHADAKDERK